MTGVARSVTVMVVLATALAACGDDGPVTTVSAFDSTFPTVTHTMVSLDAISAWEPAHEIPADGQARLVALLQADGAWMLLPSEAPVDGPTSAEVITLTSRNDPTRVTYNLVVRPAGSGEVVLSLSNRPADLDPCSSLFPDYLQVTVRSIEGCALLVNGGVDFLNWVEDGRWFHAEWDGIDLDSVVSWLETWRRIP